jgi:hypothetical protein
MPCALMFSSPQQVAREPGLHTMLVDDFPWFRSNLGRWCINIREDYGIPERDLVEFRNAAKSFLQ